MREDDYGNCVFVAGPRLNLGLCWFSPCEPCIYGFSLLKSHSVDVFRTCDWNATLWYEETILPAQSNVLMKRPDRTHPLHTGTTSR